MSTMAHNGKALYVSVCTHLGFGLSTGVASSLDRCSFPNLDVFRLRSQLWIRCSTSSRQDRPLRMLHVQCSRMTFGDYQTPLTTRLEGSRAATNAVSALWHSTWPVASTRCLYNVSKRLYCDSAVSSSEHLVCGMLLELIASFVPRIDTFATGAISLGLITFSLASSDPAGFAVPGLASAELAIGCEHAGFPQLHACAQG